MIKIEDIYTNFYIASANCGGQWSRVWKGLLALQGRSLILDNRQAMLGNKGSIGFVWNKGYRGLS